MVAIEMARIAYGDGHRALAVAMVYHAVKDMRDTGVQSKTQLRYGSSKTELRIGATVWLASKAARWWFDNIGVEQRYGLWKMGWQSHAKQLLADDGIELSPEEHLVLEFGLSAISPTV